MVPVGESKNILKSKRATVYSYESPQQKVQTLFVMATEQALISQNIQELLTLLGVTPLPATMICP